MITREQVADLQPGDVVEMRDARWPDVVIQGPIRITDDGRSYAVGEVGLAPRFLPEYREPYSALTRTLTVVSRAPRPLYVNHDRTEPVPGDVVGDDRGGDVETWSWFIGGDGAGLWRQTHGYICTKGQELPTRLRLLVDGETGRCVP